MEPADIAMQPEEQQRANYLVRQLAKCLGAPFGAEVLPNGLLVYALHGGWRIDVYLELPDQGKDSSPGLWVLILSRADERAYRAFSGGDVETAARYVRRFVADGDYRRRCLRQAGPSQAGPRSRRVLVVEDRRETADALRALLEVVGYEVRVATTGPDGLEQAAAWRPDAVLCDIGLPGLDGLAVARRLRRDPATARVCLVAVTGCGTEGDRARAGRAGFDHFFTKPADPAAVLQVLPRPSPGSGIGWRERAPFRPGHKDDTATITR